MSDDVERALAPVCASLLRGAEAEAGRILAEAHAQADSIVQQARSGAAETVGRARARGEADAAPAAAAERSRGRDQARSIILGAQSEAYQDLRAQVLSAVASLQTEPGYQGLLSRLVTMATRAAGPAAAVTVRPEGGVVARSRDIVVDCTLPRLAGLAVDQLGDQVRELWTP
ncbi:MAG TPA: V-type ATP synthase subunit E family protein [Streptosporangiaceae bacterium]|nr:V-type ATP synthase subunit E family protein [Streptosporangiaceae bacterium]